MPSVASLQHAVLVMPALLSGWHGQRAIVKVAVRLCQPDELSLLLLLEHKGKLKGRRLWLVKYYNTCTYIPGYLAT